KTPPYAGPDDFTPYLVAYVDLPGQLKVEARLVDIEEDEVEIGLPVELKVVPDINGAPGSVMHAFRPMAKGAA
ncbi:MAG: OB-fold domain-containing protein, partial [Pseudomonadota bacterium]|nr:OB-fold domain-containing protein [Pseudomonadota bacterium]